MPGSDSLTREEQVSSLTIGAFDDCLLNIDLPNINITRCLASAHKCWRLSMGQRVQCILCHPGV
jgi:hypothetical protein